MCRDYARSPRQDLRVPSRLRLLRRRLRLLFSKSLNYRLQTLGINYRHGMNAQTRTSSCTAMLLALIPALARALSLGSVCVRADSP